jgi:hypothetical protein
LVVFPDEVFSFGQAHASVVFELLHNQLGDLIKALVAFKRRRLELYLLLELLLEQFRDFGLVLYSFGDVQEGLFTGL